MAVQILACPMCSRHLKVHSSTLEGTCPKCGTFLKVNRHTVSDNPYPVGFDRANEEYEDFHGKKPRRTRKINIPDLSGVGWVLGDLESLVYKPPNTSRRGKMRWEHEFGDYGFGPKGKEKPLLVSSDDGNILLIVRDRSKFKVDPKRGIVG